LEDDPTSQLLHHTYLMTGDPLHRTSFPGDFAEFLSRSPTLSGSSCPTRHPALTDPSPKLVFSFYRRSDKVWGMTPPLDFRTTQATREAQLCTEPHFRAILRNSYQDRPRRRAGAAVLGRQAWRRRMRWTGVWIVIKGSKHKDAFSRNTEIRLGISTHAGRLRTLWQVSYAKSTV
jgi:hypothetical protein